MTLTLIFIIMLAASFLGMAAILFRKIPALVRLPESVKHEGSNFLISKFKNVIKKLPGASKFNYELYLQKILSKIRIATLKTENQTGFWLEKLRQRANQKNGHKNDSYWEELKKTKGPR